MAPTYLRQIAPVFINGNAISVSGGRSIKNVSDSKVTWGFHRACKFTIVGNNDDLYFYLEIKLTTIEQTQMLTYKAHNHD